MRPRTREDRWRTRLMPKNSLVDLTLAIVAVVAIGAALWNLHAATAGLVVQALPIDGTPATIFRSVSGPPGPVVVIAHGFAGSQQLMQPFATTLARNGYVAVTFDFPGHARNPLPLADDITHVEGATRTLVKATEQIAATVRSLGDGRLAVLGHSMASDIVVRVAEETAGVAATVAVSMFSPAVTRKQPKNLLVIVGDWESRLKREALSAAGLVSAPAEPQEGVTYGDVEAGTARRAEFSPAVEHIGVLYSAASMDAALSWLDAVFGRSAPAPRILDARGPWIMLLLAGVLGLARPASRFLPVVSAIPLGAGLRWRQLWPALIVPAVTTPLILRLLPTHFLPVLVADYLAAYFALYGLITTSCLWWQRRAFAFEGWQVRWLKDLAAACAMTFYGGVALALPLDSYVTSFMPGRGRVILIAAMLVGTLIYFLSDEWLTRGPNVGRGAYLASKVAFLLSLALAVALDFKRLFFLIIVVPVIIVFFAVYGTFSAWAYRRTGHPFVAGLASAIAFAWAIGVTFPLLAG